MSILETIGKPEDRPVMATICGDSGLGKTTLAASFPKPIIIRAEDGLQAIPTEERPDAFPVLQDVQMLWDQLTGLLREEHDYKTLVIDSASALERMFIQYIIDNDVRADGTKPKSINQALGGYGAGLNALAAMHQRVRKAAGFLNERKNMHVVFTAHADTEMIELPDQDPYTRYSLRLSKRSVAPYVDDVDLVGFLKLETLIRGKDGERKKAISDGTRLLVTYATAANISKNRYGITEDLTVEKGANPLVEYVSSLRV